MKGKFIIMNKDATITKELFNFDEQSNWKLKTHFGMSIVMKILLIFLEIYLII